MFYYIYKIVHTPSGKFYIGRRASKVSPELDAYMGSGKRVLLAINKYGLSEFTKEILSTHLTLDELVAEEKRVVDSRLLLDPMCYNLAEGGWGGYTYYDERVYTHSDEARAKITASKIGRARPDLVERHKTKGHFCSWEGRARTDEDKTNKSKAAKLAYAEGRHGSLVDTVCPHCSTASRSKPNMLRWHFDNCKHKGEIKLDEH